MREIERTNPFNFPPFFTTDRCLGDGNRGAKNPQEITPDSFPEELELLSKSQDGTQVKKSSNLRSLDPIIVNGVLRVSGRLSLASTAFEAKHQIILPKKDHVTNLVVNITTRSPVTLAESMLSVLRARSFGS